MVCLLYQPFEQIKSFFAKMIIKRWLFISMLDLDCCDLIINQTTCGTNIPFWLSQFFPLLNLLYLSLLVNIGDYKFTIILLVFFFQSENGVRVILRWVLNLGIWLNLEDLELTLNYNVIQWCISSILINFKRLFYLYDISFYYFTCSKNLFSFLHIQIFKKFIEFIEIRF